MLKDGLYEQVINDKLDTELAECTDKLSTTASIDKAEASKVLSKYLTEVVEKGLDMNKPYIICHMVTSIDGKVTGDFLSRPECEKATEIYYEINRNYKADGFICGRETMQESFAGKEDAPRYKYKNVDVPSGDFIGDKNAKFFAVSFDKHGHIGWKSNYIKDEDPGYDNAHIIEIVEGDAVSTLSLAYFRDIGISYIGADTMGPNIPLALQKLKENFGINKLLLEGGSAINSSFLGAGVIDELSLVVAPVTANHADKSLFEYSKITDFELKEVKQYDGGVVWMNYKKAEK